MKKLILICFCFLLPHLLEAQHLFNDWYKGNNVRQIAFPIGGMGAGMFCIEGSGAISNMSIMHHPELSNEPLMFAALSIKGMPGSTRVLEGPVPDRKKNVFAPQTTSWGLARFRGVQFRSRFPFAEIRLVDQKLPVQVRITAWSPFIPTDADNSSLPAGALEYHFKNTSLKKQAYVFSYNSSNFLKGEGKSIKPFKGGYILEQEHNEFSIFTDEPSVTVDHCWFRGGWWDGLSMAWNKIESGNIQAIPPTDKDAPGASLYVPFTLKPGEEKTIRVMMAWYVPNSTLRTGPPATQVTDTTFYKPWYASKFKNINEVAAYWKDSYNRSKSNTTLFTNAFYKSSLPPEVLEAIAANLTILKSPTVLRQYDGRFWGWEGSNDNTGSCAGSCTHVWNYEQALANLFPAMERSIRETELNESMDAMGHQNYRAALPIRRAPHNYYLPAADGQLGSIMRAYRDWRISGDDNWIKALYPKLKLSLDYCIKTWDPQHTGTLVKPHHNTYDIEFCGPEPMCTSIYLGALDAMIEIKNEDNSLYRELLQKGKAALNNQLYNGQYFYQRTDNREDPTASEDDSPEAKALFAKEGPKYQYGKGCLSDGMIGAWEAKLFGLPLPADEQKIKSHLESVYRYNYKKNLSGFSNPQRPFFALGTDGGLLLCSWPKGCKLSLPFVYSNEVWTGVEYEAASHLMMSGEVRKGLDIVRTARQRYDGRTRNPFDEIEAGHWYARAMSSYALLQALTGVRYDAVDKTLYVHSQIGDFTTFLSTNTGFGNVVYKNGKVTLHSVYGTTPVQHIVKEN